jgi:hypothetical protein
LKIPVMSRASLPGANQHCAGLLLQCPMPCIIVSRAAKNSQLCQQPTNQDLPEPRTSHQLAACEVVCWGGVVRAVGIRHT